MSSIDDLFPLAPRVVYRANALLNVVCQIRFPTLLRIEAQPPVELQEAIRDRFPLLERTANPALQNLPQELLTAIGAQAGNGLYVFRTDDAGVSATLGADSLTIETGSYRKWEDFWQLAAHCFESFLAIYQPSFIVRSGLRYQNAIRKSRIGATDMPWSELLSSNVLGELANNAWEATANDSRRVIRCKDSFGDSVLLQHGFGQIEGENEQIYLVDFDFYRDERIGCGEIFDAFSRFNSRSGRAFRWSISDKLHTILGPDELNAA